MGFRSSLALVDLVALSSGISLIRASGGPVSPLRNSKPAAFPYPISVDKVAAELLSALDTTSHKSNARELTVRVTYRPKEFTGGIATLSGRSGVQ